MTDVVSTENSYKNHRERCICMACSIVAIATEAAEVIDRLENRFERLREERDEARREVCQLRSTSYPHDMKEAYEIADSRGWDCYKDVRNDND
jgi:hypothetical protein